MSQLPMYPPKDGSPETTLSNPLAETDTSAGITEMACFPAIGTEGANLINFYDTSGNWERCPYTAKSLASGSGTLTIARSGTAWASSSGSPIAWPSGTKCARVPTGYDHKAYKNNIENHESRLAVAEKNASINELTSESGIVDADEFLFYDVSASATRKGTRANLVSGLATSTKSNQTIYVDKAATGTADGTSWTNAFTSIQSAVDSTPDMINHDILIIARKGSTPYDEEISIQKKVNKGSLTIRGEYYWYGTNTSSKTGKFDLGSGDVGYSDRSNIAAGDYVILTKWTSTIEGSAVVESVVDIVASVSGTEITLSTNTSKAFTSVWSYIIVKTVINTTTGTRALDILSTNSLSILGLKISHSSNYAYYNVGSINQIINACYLGSVFTGFAYVTKYRSYFEKANNVVQISDLSKGLCYYCIFQNTTTGSAIVGSNSSNVYLKYCHIRSGSVVGITASSNASITGTCLNSATTPKSPATSSDGAYISVS